MSTPDTQVLSMGHESTHSIIAGLVLMGVATLLVAVRFYTRRHIIKAVQWSDWTVLVALMLSMAFVGIFITAVLYGMGLQEAEITTTDFNRQKKLFWVSVPFYNAAMVTAKASIIIQYFHVFPTKQMRIVCWMVSTILTIYGVWSVLSAFLNCIPVASFWDSSTEGHCLDYKGLWYSNTALNIVTDVVILIIPVPALAALDLSLRQKVGLCCVFAVGGFVCITSVFRLLSVIALVSSNGRSYDCLAVMMWSAIECNTGIICACLPTLRPAIVRLWPALSGLLVSRRQRSSSDSITSFYGGSENSAALFGRDVHITTRGVESNRGSVVKAKSGTDSDRGSGMQQAPNVRMVPMPGNGFAQDLARKGSFFEQQQQRPSSYV
ncbi:integral membrane protein, putative [Talaromyces stipitatus ATCC 10500]|uniref:Integral membrane protein, putative n=1 Tax=Talaromyces stipitatus (strain ATCC 10500 / CBS 375.48 / QM 6759 / NRRL 1006) TaxID=441959 RepID=B8M9R6_TALSN|nr:integral membrane protein, putative [Talaromyces stipitatus ATCC 10500]EED18068.1 integral membrane protein, putative [Talaromyces stipitatus ATCC 10500]